MSEINVKIKQHNINIAINRIGGNGLNVIDGITITANVATEIDTQQSSIKPRFITFEDENGKRIDKNLPEPVRALDTTWKITIAKQAIGYNNVTMYYI